jgi:RNA polymerase primary sigma factor
MKSAPLPLPSEPEPDLSEDVDNRAAPSSRVRPSEARDLSPDRDVLDRYYADLAGRRRLTREGEIAVGRRVEAGERAILEAWLGSPCALRELARTAEDVRIGVLQIGDLLIEVEARDAAAAEAWGARLAALLEQLRAFASSPLQGAARARVHAELSAGLADLPLDAAFVERIERCLREAAAVGPDAERAAAAATLAEIARARRVVARARGELVEANLRLVVAIARQFRRPDVPLVDLAQEGNLGLIRAADRFDYRRGHRFSTYAVWWIKQSIRRALLGQGKGLRMPAHLAEAKRRITRVRRDFVAHHGREPSPEEIAERSDLSIERVHAIAELALEPLSLDAPVGEDGDTSFGELVAGSEPLADELLARRRQREEVRALLDGITERERDVIIRRFGLHDREEETLEEIGRSCSLTRERIRQVEEHALEKLRARSRRQTPRPADPARGKRSSAGAARSTSAPSPEPERRSAPLSASGPPPGPGRLGPASG